MKVRELLLRYRKDPRFIIAIPLLILAATSLIYYVVQRAKELSPEALSSQVLLFVLWNINVLLILGILFVLLRGVVKLVLDRQRGIIGSRFRTKLVVTYVATSLLPVVLLFLVATDLLRVSIDRWFTTPVRKILWDVPGVACVTVTEASPVALMTGVLTLTCRSGQELGSGLLVGLDPEDGDVEEEADAEDDADGVALGLAVDEPVGEGLGLATGAGAQRFVDAVHGCQETPSKVSNDSSRTSAPWLVRMRRAFVLLVPSGPARS